ncbi:hypothetical protein D3OALGB2SA_2501 [Olavius algarvensis associated proteobacterium Delta 3]|nr:hypothetical protein D3OALGB2SA_2501 [Olavius algarvensis associated proteobacterium Delta 3]
MKRTCAALFAFVFFTLAAIPSQAMICGRHMVKVGDFKFEVVEWCGEPVFAEVTGYGDCRHGKGGLKVEQLVYGPLHGKYYVLTIVGGKLKKIEIRLKR